MDGRLDRVLGTSDDDIDRDRVNTGLSVLTAH
jgi:hypothetical protein